MKLFLFFILFINSAFATIDLNYGVQGRSFPSPGGEAYVESGKNLVFWGDPNSKLFGLIRPSLQLRSNVVINTIGGNLEFYPISFIGFEAGFTNIYSNYEKFVYYNCKTSRCSGELHKNFTAAKIALGYKDVIAVTRFEYALNKYDDPTGDNKPVVEFLYGTLANPHHDNFTFSQSFLGYKLDDTKLVGIANEFVHFEGSRMTYQSTFLVYNTKKDDESFTYGLGTLETTHWGKGIVFNFKWNKTVFNSLKLF